MNERRIPFTREDEERINSVGVWGMIAAITSIATAVLGVVITLAQGSVGNALGQLIGLTLNVILGIWLIQASGAFRKMAQTDEADVHYLLLGFSKLRSYFMMTGILIIIVVCLVILGMLAALTCGAMLRSRGMGG